MDTFSEDQSNSPASTKTSCLLALPRELRDPILLYTVLNDLFDFSATNQRPACPFVCKQLQEEYCDILLNTRGLLKLDAYQGSTRSWHEVMDLQTKQDIFLHCVFAVPLFPSSNTPLGLLEFRGGAKRVCDELYREHGDGVRMGVLTICTARTAVKRWHWSIVSPPGGKTMM